MDTGWADKTILVDREICHSLTAVSVFDTDPLEEPRLALTQHDMAFTQIIVRVYVYPFCIEVLEGEERPNKKRRKNGDARGKDRQPAQEAAKSSKGARGGV